MTIWSLLLASAFVLAIGMVVMTVSNVHPRIGVIGSVITVAAIMTAAFAISDAIVSHSTLLLDARSDIRHGIIGGTIASFLLLLLADVFSQRIEIFKDK